MDLATPKTTIDKALSTAQALAKATGIGALRGGPSMSTVQPTVTEAMPSAEAQTAPAEADYDALRREAERRGLTVE